METCFLMSNPTVINSHHVCVTSNCLLFCRSSPNKFQYSFLPPPFQWTASHQGLWWPDFQCQGKYFNSYISWVYCCIFPRELLNPPETLFPHTICTNNIFWFFFSSLIRLGILCCCWSPRSFCFCQRLLLSKFLSRFSSLISLFPVTEILGEWL